MSLDIVNAHADRGEAKKGVSRAHFFECDDGWEYLVKFFEDGRDKTAINELVAGAIAMRIDLPTPVRVLVNVSNEIISLSKGLRERGIAAGLHIGVRLLENAWDFDELPEEILQERILENGRFLYGVVAFDQWLLNGDRDNSGNNMIQLLDNSQMRYMMVDFGHCFTGDIWTESLENSKANIDLMPLFSFIRDQIHNFREFEAWFNEIEGFSDANINEIVNSIPPAGNLSPIEREVLIDLIQFRRIFPRHILSNNRTRLGI